MKRRRPRSSDFWISATPLLAYGASFLGVLLSYRLGWSLLYPPLSTEVVLFVVATTLTCFVVVAFERMTMRRQSSRTPTWWTLRRVKITLVLSYFIALLECAHAGGVPLFFVASGVDYDYRDFGIPTLHVVFFCFYNFLAIHWFSLFLRTRERRYLLHSLLLVFINLLFVNRGAVVQCMIAMALMFIALRGVRQITALYLTGIVLASIYAFGYVGDLRSQSLGIDSAATISVIGDASDSYPVDVIGTGPFWVYLYASSPLANFQLNVAQGTTVHADPDVFFALEMAPDFLGKRLVPDTVFSMAPLLITDALTVSTAYGRAFHLLGWAGAIIVFMIFLTYLAVARVIFRGTEYFSSAMAVMGSGAALMAYYNMMTFSGLIGSLFAAAIVRFACVRRRSGARPSRAILPNTREQDAFQN
jgi:hypothetical protein